MLINSILLNAQYKITDKILNFSFGMYYPTNPCALLCSVSVDTL